MPRILLNTEIIAGGELLVTNDLGALGNAFFGVALYFFSVFPRINIDPELNQSNLDHLGLLL
jgi:hypothetical protein